MIEALTTASQTCDANGCDRPLPAEAAIAIETEAGRRCAYECACGAVTVTVCRTGEGGDGGVSRRSE